MRYVLLLLLSYTAWGQRPPDAGGHVSPPSAVTVVRQAPTNWMRQQIKTVQQFIERYNGAMRPEGRPEGEATGTLASLFDEDDARLRFRDAGAVSLHYRERVALFLEENATQPAPLPSPPRLLARAAFRVWQGNQTDTLLVYLAKRYTPSRAAYWQVVGAGGAERLLALPAPPPTPAPRPDTAQRTDRWLPPTAHEVAFLPLYRGLLATHSLRHFAPDTLAFSAHEQAIETALQSGRWLVDGPLSTRVYLDTGQNWVLLLEEFIREKANSGWLIADLFDPPAYAALPLSIRQQLR